jgi:WD40 repeat protein
MSCSADNKLVIWDLKGVVLEEKIIGRGETYSAKISPCARYVTACGKHDDPDMVLYDVNVPEDANGQYRQMTTSFKLKGHKEGVYSFDIGTDSSKIVTLGFDMVWRLFDTTGKLAADWVIVCN